jgi:hypothetical protein
MVVYVCCLLQAGLECHMQSSALGRGGSNHHMTARVAKQKKRQEG